jgi:hypothetical protein
MRACPVGVRLPPTALEAVKLTSDSASEGRIRKSRPPPPVAVRRGPLLQTALRR